MKNRGYRISEETREEIKYMLQKIRAFLTNRLFIIFVLFGVMLASLCMRLFELQIAAGETVREIMSAPEPTPRTSLISNPITPARGNIYDKNGVLLAYSEQ